MALFKDESKPLHKRIAALLVKIFVEIEGNQFERRLDEVLKIISLEINFEQFNQVKTYTFFLNIFLTINLTIIFQEYG